MKSNIPFSYFYNYYKDESLHRLDDSKDRINKNTQWLNAMSGVTWEDLESLNPDEMIRIPICWVYDWTHVTANYDLQEEVEHLYKRYNLPIYDIKQYLMFFKPSSEKPSNRLN